MNANVLVTIPIHTPTIKGFVENETIEPRANVNIFNKSYFDTPENLSPAV